MIKIQMQYLGWILALSAKIDDKFGCTNNLNFRIKVHGYATLVFLPKFRTNVSLFESVILFGARQVVEFSGSQNAKW